MGKGSMNKLPKAITSSEFLLRTASALVLAPIILLAVYAGGMAFYVLILLCCISMSWEWAQLIRHRYSGKQQALCILTWAGLGFFYIIIPCACLVVLRELVGMAVVFWILLSVWSVDIGAYIAGISIGGPKIAPSISPKKTWAGFIGGTLAAVVAGLVFTQLGITVKINSVINSIGLAVVAQIGDLLESALKRHFNVKDSGKLIPGHGGILDRVDSIVTAAIYAAIMHIIHLVWL